jgi:hypothetical protein
MAVDAIEKYIPTEGLFRIYHNYTMGNEICPRFRFYAFAAAVGSLVKRKVSFQRSSYNLFPTLYPNPWIVLVAPQGRGHKSAALSIAKKMIMRLEQKYQPRLMASKLTPEALVKALAAQALTAEIMKNVDPNLISIVKKPAQALLYSSELGVLLGKEKYNQGMIALLTDLYDTPDEWISETVMRGDQRLYDVCLSIMGASTPDWMQTMLPADAFKGGFMSRLLLIGYPETWSIRIADPPPPDEKLGVEVLERLDDIAKLEGAINWTTDAKNYFESWYCELKDPEPGPKAAYLERKQDHILRLAILIQLGWGPQLVLTKEAIEHSMALIHAIEPDTLRMVEYISVEPRMRFVQRIIELLEARQRISEGELMSESWKYLSRPSEFQDTIQMLLKSKQVAMSIEGTDLVYTYLGKGTK